MLDAGGCAPLHICVNGLRNKVSNKTASGYPQWYGTEAHRVFFRPGSAAKSNCSIGKLALPGSWRMPRLHDMWRRGLCRTITCTAALRVWHFSAFHYQMNCIITITMFVPFTLFHVDRHLKRLDNHSQYSVE